jgi:hypothetical protein
MSKTKVISIKPRYEWREDSPFATMGLDPQAVGERLEALSLHGPVTSDMIVADAQRPTSVFHRMFEWDDTKAAEKYRRTQAAQITGHLVTKAKMPGNGVQSVRAFVSLTPAGPSKQVGYVPAAKAPVELEVKAERELMAWCRRYAGVKNLRGLVQTVYLAVEPELEKKTG